VLLVTQEAQEVTIARIMLLPAAADEGDILCGSPSGRCGASGEKRDGRE
jgi:hypothetical protein